MADDYAKVLLQQKAFLNDGISWWPEFLYHFTDVHNAVGILQDGFIWSREQADAKHVMQNDNASHAVISATDDTNKSYGRLYFRPLTPTQYHSEGYKPPVTRNTSIDASCPVPVFICLDVNEMLNLDGTCYAEKGISGHRHDIRSGIEDFQQLDFQKIYHDGPYNKEIDADIREYRQTEVIRPIGFPLKAGSVRAILCRSEAERETFMYLLRMRQDSLYNKYCRRIFYRSDLRCFYNNGIFVKKVYVSNGNLVFEFNDPEQRVKNDTGHVSVDARLFLTYKGLDGNVISAVEGRGVIDYNYARSLSFKLDERVDSDIIQIALSLDDNFMYENELDIRRMIVV